LCLFIPLIIISCFTAFGVLGALILMGFGFHLGGLPCHLGLVGANMIDWLDSDDAARWRMAGKAFPTGFVLLFLFIA
jgi:hypothetical protein